MKQTNSKLKEIKDFLKQELYHELKKEIRQEVADEFEERFMTVLATHVEQVLLHNVQVHVSESSVGVHSQILMNGKGGQSSINYHSDFVLVQRIQPHVETIVNNLLIKHNLI